MRLIIISILVIIIGSCSNPPSLLEQVLEKGELRVVTRSSPTSFTLNSSLEHDLAKAFANSLGVNLVVESVDSYEEILPELLSGKFHMVAAGTALSKLHHKHLNFGRPYRFDDVHMIYKLGTGKPKSLEDVLERSIEVLTNSDHVEILSNLKKSYPSLEWVERNNTEFGDLLARVSSGEIDLTISNTSDYHIQRHFYPNLRIALNLIKNSPISWAFPKNSGDTLLAEADSFLIKSDRNGLITQINDRYFGFTKKFDYVGTRDFIRHFKSRLPQYREIFEQAGEKWEVDWRLLAAIGYQESHWLPDAKSPTGVRGIMMLTLDTAADLGLKDRLDPKNSIFGGAQYFSKQTKRLDSSIKEPDRTWMALAAYNVGFNHIKDARQIVTWDGGNPDRWIDLRKALPLLSQRKYYSRLPYGYARGSEPVLYVDNVRGYYEILLWLTEKEKFESVAENKVDKKIDKSNAEI